ncbi:hypothetical protein Q8W71_22705 [Methylobacterium sp. NEAU 140]|uniref:hypothetical protein n=1 Tax=Methylobacterium sp. NEAU 140 TaxID=3064945 RepID=UPI0027363161|nr:hypothetical protein [Methylobacterium sp. NEAU 140]MDP4025447.1 hypothetical protein [Methylobacterium sp. NEAU 140]
MSRSADHERRLGEAKVMAGLLADRMMAAYVVGGRPTEAEIRALCRAVLLLEEHAVPLPAFAEDVIGRLAAQDEADASPPPAPAPPARRTSALGRVLRPLRARLAA